MKRLPEQYPLHTAVEIYFNPPAQWVAGVIIAHAAPSAVWVQTADGRRWFVTNGRRIRAVSSEQ